MIDEGRLGSGEGVDCDDDELDDELDDEEGVGLKTPVMSLMIEGTRPPPVVVVVETAGDGVVRVCEVVVGKKLGTAGWLTKSFFRRVAREGVQVKNCRRTRGPSMAPRRGDRKKGVCGCCQKVRGTGIWTRGKVGSTRLRVHAS